MAEEIKDVDQSALNQSTKGIVASGFVAVNVTATRKVASAADNNRPFEVGERIVHPAHGVGVVQDIQARVVSGIEQKFYQIVILDSSMKIMVPVSQASAVGLRRIVDHDVVSQVYDILRDRNIVVNSQTWNRRHREYNQKIKTGSLFEIAKVVRDLSVLRASKELSYGERTMLEMARGRLVQEIAISLAQPEDIVLAELKEISQVTAQ